MAGTAPFAREVLTSTSFGSGCGTGVSIVARSFGDHRAIDGTILAVGLIRGVLHANDRHNREVDTVYAFSARVACVSICRHTFTRRTRKVPLFRSSTQQKLTSRLSTLTRKLLSPSPDTTVAEYRHTALLITQAVHCTSCRQQTERIVISIDLMFIR